MRFRNEKFQDYLPFKPEACLIKQEPGKFRDEVNATGKGNGWNNSFATELVYHPSE